MDLLEYLKWLTWRELARGLEADFDLQQADLARTCTIAWSDFDLHKVNLA